MMMFLDTGLSAHYYVRRLRKLRMLGRACGDHVTVGILKIYGELHAHIVVSTVHVTIFCGV
jgi:hypothetical protein